MPAPEEVKEVVVEDDTPKEEQVTIPPKGEEKTASESEKLAAQIRDDFDKLYGSRLESVESRLRESLRKNDQLKTELQKLSEQPKPVPTPTQVQAEKDELDALVEQGRWKEAVSKLAAQQAQEIVRQQQVLEQQQVALQQRQSYFEQAKQTVINRYPDLDPEMGNEESVISTEFNKVLNEHPWLLKEPLGPTEAMRIAEERLTEQGVDLSQFRAKVEPIADNKEVIRRQRANLSGLPTSRGTAKPGTVTIGKSEKEFIDYWGIDPQEYVKNKQVAETGGGIEA